MDAWATRRRYALPSARTRSGRRSGPARRGGGAETQGMSERSPSMRSRATPLATTEGGSRRADGVGCGSISVTRSKSPGPQRGPSHGDRPPRSAPSWTVRRDRARRDRPLGRRGGSACAGGDRLFRPRCDPERGGANRRAGRSHPRRLLASRSPVNSDSATSTLIIRTSGEKRLSDFPLLWESAYAGSSTSPSGCGPISMRRTSPKRSRVLVGASASIWQACSALPAEHALECAS